jgi:hypothetical protein
MTAVAKEIHRLALLWRGWAIGDVPEDEVFPEKPCERSHTSVERDWLYSKAAAKPFDGGIGQSAGPAADEGEERQPLDRQPTAGKLPIAEVSRPQDYPPAQLARLVNVLHPHDVHEVFQPLGASSYPKAFQKHQGGMLSYSVEQVVQVLLRQGAAVHEP